MANFIVSRYIVPFEGNDTRSQERFPDLTTAKKRWHSIIASDIDKTSFAAELVQIVRLEDGVCLATETLVNAPPAEA